MMKELDEGAQVNPGTLTQFHVHSLQSEKNHNHDVTNTVQHAMKSTHSIDHKITPEIAQKTEITSETIPKDHQSQNVPISPAVQPHSSNHERLDRTFAEAAGSSSSRRGGEH